MYNLSVLCCFVENNGAIFSYNSTMLNKIITQPNGQGQCTTPNDETCPTCFPHSYSLAMPQTNEVDQSPQAKRLSGNVFLIGMMGSGKTTVGRCLALQMNKTFIDSDDEIQFRTGVSIPHIFDVEGEVGFRQREACVIHDLVRRDNLVLATGGGAILSEFSRHALRRNGLVVYLKSTVHDLWQRTRHDRNRPLLQTNDPRAKLKELFELRDPLYTQVADLIMPTGKQSVQTLVTLLQQEVSRLQTT